MNKTPGFLVDSDHCCEKPTVTSILEHQLANNSAKKHLSVLPCHRLDRDTSGVIVYALDKKSQQNIMQQFKLRKVLKKYIAYVQGRMERMSGEIRSFIDTKYPYFSANKNRGKLAITKFKVIDICNFFSIVEARPLTGRTNQLRIHFRQIKHPIIGERKYAFGKDFLLKFKRVALHAAEIRFYHPGTLKLMKFSAPLPKDMKDFCAKNG
ncbi:MAG: RNA pseudouridine synthase [Candidatus Omnitrophota bacterium]